MALPCSKSTMRTPKQCERPVHFFFLLLFFFLICKAEQPLRGMELEEKKHKKRLQDTENLFRKYL